MSTNTGPEIMMNNEYNLAKNKNQQKRDHDEYYYSRKSIFLLVSILFIKHDGRQSSYYPQSTLTKNKIKKILSTHSTSSK